MRTTLPYLRTYANKLKDKYYPNIPKVYVGKLDTLGKSIGGRAYSDHSMYLSTWMLADKEEAKSTVRHELAHNIVNYLRRRNELPKTSYISHGREFHQILKKIAPRTWRQDLYWNSTPAITEARAKHGIVDKAHKYRETKWFTCANPDCTYKHLWGWKAIPRYIKNGWFKGCECGCDTIIQTNTTKKPLIFTSVH